MSDEKGEMMPSGIFPDILDKIDSAVFVEDFSGGILYVNQRACEMFGYSRQEFYEKGISLIVTPREMDRLADLVAQIRKKGKIRFEAVNRDAKGNVFPVSLYCVLDRWNGQPVVIVSVTDLRPERKHEKLANLLAEHVRDAVIITDGEGRVQFWNLAAEELFGYMRAEVIGKKFYEYISTDPEQYREVLESYRNGDTNGNLPRIGIGRFKTRDGTVFIGEVTHSVIHTDHSVYGIVVVRDITEREMQKQLKESMLKRYETILDKMLSGVMIIRDEEIIYANQGFKDITGYDYRKEKNFKFQKIIYPEDLPMVEANYRHRMNDEPAPNEYQVRFVRKDGKVVWVVIKPVKITLNGEDAELVSMMDITRIKSMEENLISMEQVVRELDRAKSENEMYRIIWSKLHRDLKIDALIFIGSDDNLTVNESFGEEINCSYRTKRCLRREAESNHRYLSWHRARACGFDEHLNMSFYIFTLRDDYRDYGMMVVGKRGDDAITSDEQVLMDIMGAHLFLSLKNLNSIEDAKKSRNLQELLVHILTHDLKTHLAVISGYADLLTEKYNSDYVKEIKMAVNSAVEVIDKTNMFSKLDMGHIKQARQRTRVFALVAAAISTVKQKHPDAHIHVVGGGEYIVCYPILMQEVLYNLINNAFVHGAKNVTVKTESADGKVRIYVMDDGPGIAEEIRDRIFDPFFKYRSGGSGLGLAIVRRVVELHGGSISVRPNDPKGSIFVIELPNGL